MVEIGKAIYVAYLDHFRSINWMEEQNGLGRDLALLFLYLELDDLENPEAKARVRREIARASCEHRYPDRDTSIIKDGTLKG